MFNLPEIQNPEDDGGSVWAIGLAYLNVADDSVAITEILCIGEADWGTAYSPLSVTTWKCEYFLS